MTKKKTHKRRVLKVTTTPSIKKEKTKATGVRKIVPRGEGVFPRDGKIRYENHFNKVPKIPSVHFSNIDIKEFRDAKRVNMPKHKLAIILHLYYHDLSTQFLKELKVLKKQMQLDLYVTIVKGSNADDIKLKEAYKKLANQVKIVPNAGKDILPKLTVLNELVKKKKKYDYVFLLHDKKSPSYERSMRSEWMDTWRQDLTSLLFDQSLREQCLFTLDSFPQIGILGHLKHLHYGPGWHKHLYRGRRYLNESKLLNFQVKIKQHLSIPIKAKPSARNLKYVSPAPCEQTWFIGGTMFWMRWDVIEFFMEKYNIGSLLAALHQDKGDVKDPSLTHACERFFGHMAGIAGKKVCGYGQNI